VLECVLECALRPAAVPRMFAKSIVVCFCSVAWLDTLVRYFAQIQTRLLPCPTDNEITRLLEPASLNIEEPLLTSSPAIPTRWPSKNTARSR
jgi:hypothetical protein